MENEDLVFKMMCLCRLYIASNSRVLKSESDGERKKDSNYIDLFDKSYQGLCKQDKEYIKENFFFNFNMLPKVDLISHPKSKTKTVEKFVKIMTKANESM